MVCHSIIAGGAGFIGTNLVGRLLSLRHHVTVMDDLSRGCSLLEEIHCLSKCTSDYGYREKHGLFFLPQKIELPSITFDKGVIDLLTPYLLKGFRENGSAWF